MPYKNAKEAESKNPGIHVLPKHAKDVWVGAFNSSVSRGINGKPVSDADAAKIAWSAVTRAGYKKKGDKWVKMDEILKATIVVEGENIAFGIPFSKINVNDRTVEGFATLDNVDKSNEIVDFDASKEAFESWIGNVREMHAPKAVGKAIEITEKKYERDGKIYNGVWVKSRISKGAPDTWEKILDGTLAGYSIGGKVLERRPEIVKADEGRYSTRNVSRITKYHLGELSVVDNPMNALAIFEDISKGDMILKYEGQELLPGKLIVEDKALFYCANCDVAKTDDIETSTVECVTCDSMMKRIGEVSEAPTVNDLQKMVGEYKTMTQKSVNAAPSPDEHLFYDENQDGKCDECGQTNENHGPVQGTNENVELMDKAITSDVVPQRYQLHQFSMKNGKAACATCGMSMGAGNHSSAKAEPSNQNAPMTEVESSGTPSSTNSGSNMHQEPENFDNSEGHTGLMGTTDIPNYNATPEIETVNPSLVQEVSMATVTNETQTGNPQQGTVKAEDTESIAVMAETAVKLANKVRNILKGRTDKNNGVQNEPLPYDPEEMQFFEALANIEMYKVVANVHKTPPKGYPSDSSQYADPINKKYPVDSSARVRAAMVYYNHPGQREAGGYSMDQWASIGRKIASAANKTFGKGHSFGGGKVQGPSTASDSKKAELVLDLQKNDSNVNNIVDVLQRIFILLHNKSEQAPAEIGGEKSELDYKEALEKVLDIFNIAKSEAEEVLKSFSGVQSLNNEDAGGTAVGGAADDAGVGTSEANDGKETLSATDITVAKDSAMATPDAGPEKVVPDKIPTDGTGADVGTNDYTSNNIVPDKIKSDGSDDLKKVMEYIDGKFTQMTGRLEAVEGSGAGRKSGEVAADDLKKSDSSIWGGMFYSGEWDS